MLNQTFSLANFEEIYEEDNRKGKNQDDLFFPAVVVSSRRLSAKARALRAFKKRYSSYKKYPTPIQRRYDTLLNNLKKQREDREQKITAALNLAATRASQKSFSVGITKNVHHTKPVYERDDRPESYYVLRQIAKNIRQLYQTKPGNRNSIISQIDNLLKDNYPYIIIRTDISDFFESVDQKKLIEKLVADQLLSTNSIRIVKKILWDYSALSGSKGNGIPRGLGVSSDLAELFLKEVDRKIKSLDGIVYYARYVDDIFILIAPDLTIDPNTYLPKIRSLVSDVGLSLNESKTSQITRDDHSKRIEYLGYEFSLKSSVPEIDITKSKFDRIKFRISQSFRLYERHRHTNAKSAYRLLIKRIKFLTSNTRLSNSKGNAFVGVYFSNINVNCYRRLKALDMLLAHNINKIQSISLREKLTNLSFEKGHREKTFSRFNRRFRANQKDEFSQIVEAWRNEN